MNVIMLVGILCMVSSDQAVDSAFDTPSWVGRGKWDVEVEVHFFLEGFCYNMIIFDCEC